MKVLGMDKKKLRWWLGVLTLATIIFVIFVVQRKNYLADNMHPYHFDEIHTVRWALQPSTPTYRVGEANRWLARVFTPMALIHMNKNLGGYRQGFGFPGLHYYNENFNQFEMNRKGIRDPGIQDFYYSLRIQYVIFFALILFLFFLFYSYKEKYFFVPIALSIYLGGSKHLLEEQGIFYCEPLLLLMFVFGVFFLYSGTQTGHISDYAKKIPLLALWYVLAVSVKISAVFLIFIPFVIIFYEKHHPIHKKIQKCFHFFGYVGLFFVLIHITAFFNIEEKISLLVQGFTVNFWNYNRVFVEMDSAPNALKLFELIKNDFGVLFYLFVPAVFASFFMVSRRHKIIKATLLVILVLSLFSIFQQVLFLNRNIVPFYFLFLFLTLSSLWEICQKCKEKWRLQYANFVIPVLAVVLLADRLYALNSGNWGFYHTLDRTKENAVALFKKVKLKNPGIHSYSVGVDLNGLENHTSIENFSVSRFKKFPEYVEQWRERMSSQPGFLVIVNRIGRNYFLTNSILPNRGLKIRGIKKHPRPGLKLKRLGNYFVFYRKSGHRDTTKAAPPMPYFNTSLTSNPFFKNSRKALLTPLSSRPQ